MVCSVQGSRAAVVNIAVVAACVGLDRWVRRNWDLKGWSRVPRIVPLTLIDALGAYNVLRLLGQCVRKAASGSDSWEPMGKDATLCYRRANDDQGGEEYLWSDQAIVWPKGKQFEFAVFDRAIGDKEFSVGELTPDGLLCGGGGAIEIQKSVCDVTFSFTNDGADGTAAHRAFAGYLAEVRKNQNMFRVPREMIPNAIQCVRAYTLRLAYWSFGGFLYAKPYIANYQGAILRPLTEEQRTNGHTHALHALQMGRMAVFVMEKQGDKWQTLCKMVPANGDSDAAIASYLLKPGNIVCMVSGEAGKWVKHKVEEGEAFALGLCDPTLLRDGNDTITATSVRNALKGVSQDPAIVFSVPLDPVAI